MQYTYEQITEISKCADDPIYFINTYVKHYSLTKGKCQLTLYPFQEDLIKSYHSNDKIIACMHRQSGKDLVSACYLLWQAIFNSDFNIAISGFTATSSKTILNDVSTMYSWLPDFFNFDKLAKKNTNLLLFPNGSTISILPFTGIIAHRSLDIVYFSEPAHSYRDKLGECLTNLVPTLRNNYKIIINSSANSSPVLDNIWKSKHYERFSSTWEDDPSKTITWANQATSYMSEETFKKEYENYGTFR